MLAVLLPLADTASNITSGAVLTLVLPLGFALIVLAVWWWYAARHRGPASASGEEPAPEAEQPARPTQQ